MAVRPILRISGVIAVLAAVVLAGAIAYFLTFSPDRKRFPLRGIDVSHHQGMIDWQRVRDDDVAFAYVKATEGAKFVDPRFNENWQGAHHAGLGVGAYHLFSLCRSGHDQARNFLAVVPDIRGSLPSAVDLEFRSNCDARPAPETFRQELKTFLAEVERQQGREVIFYVIDDFLAAYGRSLPSRGLWRRSILREPGPSPWTFWQYHNRGWIAGIDKFVDLNVFYADGPSFTAWSARQDPALIQ